jgi:sugar lactone lactonase YvrE
MSYRGDLQNNLHRGVFSRLLKRFGAGTDSGDATASQRDTKNVCSVLSLIGFTVLFFGQSCLSFAQINGVISTVAGDATPGFKGDGGPATSAQIKDPWGVAVDSAGNLYIADYGNDRIRKVTPAGVITTVAGNGSRGYSGDGGPATSAALNAPTDIALDSAGNLYISDWDNGRVRKVTPDGVISTVAQLFSPGPVAVDPAGTPYVADSFRSSGPHRVYKVTPDGLIIVVGGGLGAPSGLAFDSAGNLYIADIGDQRVYKVTPAGMISTVAGSGAEGFSGDGGAATLAELQYPHGLALDLPGNLYIADSYNGCVRKVTPTGVISTVVFSGGDGSATSAELDFPIGVAVDGSGNLFIADSNRVRKVTFRQQTTFSLTDRGGLSLRSSGTLSGTVVGHASIHPDTGSATPAGLAIVGFRQNNVLVSEASVPASPLIQSGRIYAEVSTLVNTGLAIANFNSEATMLSFFFSDSNGNFGNGTVTIPAHTQMAKFLSESPFNAPSSLTGTFTFSSSLPVAAAAVRGLTNERSEFLMTTLPVADLSGPLLTEPIVFPHFADGGGWSTQIVLVNPTDSVLTGTVQFLSPSGTPTTVPVNNQSATSFFYSIPPRSSQKLSTSGTAPAIQSGSVRVDPATIEPVPAGLAVFSFRPDGTTVAEAAFPAVPVEPRTAFRVYAEASGSTQTGLAVANTSPSAATVTLELSNLDGSSTGLTGTLSIPARGQTAIFLNQVPGFRSLQSPFQGIVRLSSPSVIAVIGLRGRYNERGDFLMSITPAVDETALPSSLPLFFPLVVDSGGYTTQFILFTAQPGTSSSGTMQLFNQAGGALGAMF